MSNIVLFTLGDLKAVADSSPVARHVKLYWKHELLSTDPSLMGCLEKAYVGVRMFNLRYRGWLTTRLRIEVMQLLSRSILLTDGKFRHKEGMEKNMRNGITWYLAESKQAEVCVKLKSELDMNYFNSDVFSYEVRIKDSSGKQSMVFIMDDVEAADMLESLSKYRDGHVQLEATGSASVSIDCKVLIVNGEVTSFEIQ